MNSKNGFTSTNNEMLNQKVSLKLESNENNNLSCFINRKTIKLKMIFGEFWTLTKSGIIIGGIIGGTLGFIGGCFQAYAYKSMFYIPITMFASSFLFASLLGIGFSLRAEECNDNHIKEYALIDDEGNLKLFKSSLYLNNKNLKSLHSYHH